ncbi:MAG: HEAT repeat domain-containing protein [Planctomycetaceae bacterium]|nr:HEAT repeat domain-containing protein [Planctomycetales bacterium]MCB9875851.1 HEAT repeat domain-containing protein [Planctomycetaceae bacterium]MCB9938539.1 HEAT repeat domain-containing protein [Planctomycetaceae bacterium]
MLHSNLLLRAASTSLLLLFAFTELRADGFVLTTGAQVYGQWLNREDADTPYYLIATEYGGHLQLERSRVAQVIRQSESQLKYDRLAPAVADTVEDHWKIAQWCRDHDLPIQRQQHLLRVIELDSDHELAHRALGHSEIGGQWVKKEDHLERKGYVRYKGKWRLQQEIDLAEQRRSEELARKDWYVKLSRWRSQLTGDRRHAAIESIRQVRDPLAIEAIGRLLQAERDRRMRLIYVEVLGQIPDNQALAALVELALSDRDEEVYYACVDQLRASMSPPIARQFVSALKSNTNDRVNRAAIALGMLGDQSVVPPLIDALVTHHQIALPGSDMITTTFASGGPLNQSGGTYSSGPTAPQAITQTATNQEVLKTLVRLTGVSFSFDQRAWRNWYTLEQRRVSSPDTTTRRID